MSTPQATDVRKAAGIGPKTVLQKIVHPALAQLYLGNVTVPARFEPHRAGGFVVRGQDIPEGTADEFAAAFGVDQVPGWPSGPVYLLRFYAHTPLLYSTTFGGQTLEGAQKMGTSVVYPAPFLGTGYTPAGLPEYFMELSELPVGTELWRIESSGEAAAVGSYGGRRAGWTPKGSDVSFGPGRFWAPPVSLRTTVRRGLTVRFDGRDVDADFGSVPGQLVLGDVLIDDVQAEEISLLRKLCTWRGASFELLDVSGDQAVLHYLGENYEEASHLGLTEVDYRLWRTVAPRGELTDVRDESRVLPRGLFGSN